MTLANWIKENPNKIPTGFISPTGDFFYAMPLEFQYMAEEICDWYGYKVNDPIKFLRERDWDWIVPEDSKLGLIKRYL